MRKSRVARRGGAATAQLLANTQQVAPPNPRRVGVAYSELDVQEGMAGLAGLVGGERSDSMVTEIASSMDGEEFDQAGKGRGGRPLPIDMDVDQVRLLQEIRKASSQLTLESFGEGSARNSIGGGAFFMTRAGSAVGEEPDEDEEQRRGKGRKGSQRTGNSQRERGDGDSRTVGFLEGLAEFQRRIGVNTRNISRGVSFGSHDENDEDEVEDAVDDSNGVLLPGLQEFQRRLTGKARFSLGSEDDEEA
ncbi:hypothetical protein PoB_001806200 [Plakobranchus ocellatus]|uniref:Uncharacterized protein n=1 Tax=Plakobranchus ocellatus TaxID=259542 RepID=A0AAV3ZAP3_9GAST|nr:hypothetical protein PoB_001806200 [Plakobranchus ocellatus]